jgi:protoporphyrinogen oxidase
MIKEKTYTCCILGGGPAGVGTALELTEKGIKDVVIIDKNKIIGGLSRTETFDGVRFDIGPHRFFSKNDEVNKTWKDTLGPSFRPVDRLTRINYNKKYFNYPIKAVDALSKMGPVQSLNAMFSYGMSLLFNHKEPKTFEDWVSQKFGRKLYETFFKTYTEKVWGIPCSEIGAEWASQRIKGLDVLEVVKKALFTRPSKKIKTLVEQFDYPVMGAGQMYEGICERAVKKGATVILESTVVAINRNGDSIVSVDFKDPSGNITRIKAKSFFSSIPLTHFFQMLKPQDSAPVNDAASALYYRDHITVNLLVDAVDLFPDQWIYVHEPEVEMARLANYNNFSKEMVGKKNKTALSVEYFVFQNENLWKMKDDDIKAKAIDEIKYVGLIDVDTVEKGWIIRETEAYPTYYMGFREPYNLVRSRLNEYKNLYSIGRGGMYKYNNQDHSLFSGMLAARNYLRLPGSPYDLWEINEDAEYHESAVRKND